MSTPTHNAVKTSTTSPDKNTMNEDSTPSTPPTKIIQNISTLGNPFGPVVGHMKHIYACDYRQQRGEIYVASKAICFRRTTFFGLEVDRVIIPWERVSSIDESDHGTIAIKTDRDGLHEINGFDVEPRTVRDSMSDIWKRGKEMDGLDGMTDDAVRQLLKGVSMMSEFNDDETETSDEDESNLSTGKGSAVFHDGEDEIEMSADELAIMWSAICDEKDMKYTENVATKMRLNIDLNDFHDKFLRDDAVASLVKHHEASGDLDSKATKWSKTNTNTNTPKLARKRFLTYNHPINIPLSIAPPAGAATKTQIMQSFPNGICVDTETWINDVPLADCFYVADRLLVESIPESEGGGVWLTIQFGNCFVKRTMFRNIIASTSVRDVTAFHKGYIDLITETIGDDKSLLSVRVPRGVPREMEEASKAVKGGREKKRLDWNLCLIVILAFITIGNQYIISKELHEANAKLSRLEMILEQKFGMNSY